MIGNRHGARVAGVDVIEIAIVRVEDVYVADVSVVDVDIPDVAAAATEPWVVGFAVAEWEPADSETKTAAKETHKSRAIDRTAVDGARAPAPPAADIRPAPIVIWSKAPR